MIVRSTLSLATFQVLAVLLTGLLLATVVSTQTVSLTAGAALALGFLLLFLAQPEWGMLFVLLARASSDLAYYYLTAFGPRGETIGGLLNIGLILILTFAGGLYILSRGIPLISLPGGRLLALLLVAGLLGVFRSQNFIFAMNEWVPVLASLVIYALVAHLFATPRQAQRVLDLIAASFLLPAVLGVYQLITGQGRIRPEFPIPGITGTFLHPNTFGFFLVLLIALFLGQALFQTGKRRTAALAGLCVAFVLLVGTYARVAWAGAIVVLLVVGFVRAPVLLFLLPIGAVTLVGLVASVGQRVANPLAGGGSLADRLFNLWPATLQGWLSATGSEYGGFMVALNRVAGLGPGIGPALRSYGLTAVPHNDYLRVLVEYGIFGLILFLTLIGVLVIMAFRTWRQFRDTNQTAAAVALSFLAVTIAYPVMSITDNLFAHTVSEVYFWSLAGLTVAMRKWGRLHNENAPFPQSALEGLDKVFSAGRRHA